MKWTRFLLIYCFNLFWIPAFAGMTIRKGRHPRESGDPGRITRCLFLFSMFSACLPTPLVTSYAELRARAPQMLHGFTADVSFDATMPQLRVRSQGILAIRAPDRLRFDLRGPSGSIASRFVAQGDAWTLWDVASDQKWNRQSADAPAFASLLVPGAMVGVITGRFDPPDNATFMQDKNSARGAWQLGNETWRVDWDLATAMVLDIQIVTGTQTWHVSVRGRHASGVAREVFVETTEGSSILMQIGRVVVRDNLGDDVFAL